MVLWDKKLWDVNVIHKSEQYITGFFPNKLGMAFVYTFVYAHNQPEKCIQLWNYL